MSKISVIVPAYNSERFIAQTLDSLMAQTLDGVEVIIVNDGSTDGTQAVIDEYCAKSDIFKSFIQQNAGVSAARNYGLEKATGKYVVFLDADDYFTEGSLEAFYICAESTGADVVLGRLRVFNERELGKYNVFADKLAQMRDIPTFTKTVLWNFLIGNKCYNRERLMASGVRFPGFRYSEEGAFFMSFVYTGAKISGTTGSCMCYRRHTAQEGLSVSQTVSLPLAKSMLGSLKYIYDGACEALKAAPGVDAEDYLQEIIYKTAYILISQFYRRVWQGDRECFAYCAEKFSELRAAMTEARFKAMCAADRDLHLEKPCMTVEDIVQSPNVTVIIRPRSKKSFAPLLDSLYNQTSPLFQLIIPQSLADSGGLPLEYLSMANLLILPEKGFMRAARRAARAKRRIVFGTPKSLDIRDFRMLWRVPLVPEKIKDIFFPLMIRGIDFLLTKKIVE